MLVVDDEEAVRRLASRMLTWAGYQALEASHGREALATIEEHEGPVHLVLTDIKMPGMNGYQLVDASLALRPELKVMLMTGYTQDPLPKKISDAGIPLLQKPFDFEALPKLVQESLSR